MMIMVSNAFLRRFLRGIYPFQKMDKNKCPKLKSKFGIGIENIEFLQNI
jgi:hypothetical protein